MTDQKNSQPAQYLDAECCPHEYPMEGDDLHVAGEPVDMICLASPICPKCGIWTTANGHVAIEHRENGTHEMHAAAGVQ